MKELVKQELFSPQIISEIGKVLKDLQYEKIALIGAYCIAHAALKTCKIEVSFKSFSLKSIPF